MPSEFDLIQRYFNWSSPDEQVRLGVGDDAAVLALADTRQLVVTSDTLISGVHFPTQTPAHAIGYKVLAVNLSDLAAMGADPAWFTLALTLPEYNTQWLDDFSSGLKALAEHAKISLIGGDTTKGTLSITITAMGLVNAGQLLLRSAARDGDLLYVSATLGDAAAGLAVLQNRLVLPDAAPCLQQLNYPHVGYRESQVIRAYAHACLDISDGFLADLNHLLEASSVGAIIDLDAIPLSRSLQSLDRQVALRYALSGGDDYALLCAIPAHRRLAFETHMQNCQMSCYRVGVLTASVTGIVTSQQEVLDPQGYQHF